MVISGPWLRILLTATHNPTTVARTGMIQTSEGQVCLLGTVFDSGTVGGFSGSAISTSLLLRGVPNKARIERLSRKHGQHHHRGEKEKPRLGLDRHQRVKLDKR